MKQVVAFVLSLCALSVFGVFGTPKAIQECEISGREFDAFCKRMGEYFGLKIGDSLSQQEITELGKSKGPDGTYYNSRMAKLPYCLSRYCYLAHEPLVGYYVFGFMLKVDSGKMSSDDLLTELCKMGGAPDYDEQKGKDGIKIKEKDGDRCIAISTEASNGKFYILKIVCEDVAPFISDADKEGEPYFAEEEDATSSVAMAVDGSFFGYRMGMKRGDRPYVDERDFGPEYGALRRFTFKFAKTTDRLYEVTFKSDPYVSSDPKVDKVLNNFSRTFHVKTGEDVNDSYDGIDRIIKISKLPNDEKGRLMKAVYGCIVHAGTHKREMENAKREKAEALVAAPTISNEQYKKVIECAKAGKGCNPEKLGINFPVKGICGFVFGQAEAEALKLVRITQQTKQYVACDYWDCELIKPFRKFDRVSLHFKPKTGLASFELKAKVNRLEYTDADIQKELETVIGMLEKKLSIKFEISKDVSGVSQATWKIKQRLPKQLEDDIKLCNTIDWGDSRNGETIEWLHVTNHAQDELGEIEIGFTSIFHMQINPLLEWLCNRKTFDNADDGFDAL